MDVIKELKNDGINKGLCRLWQMKLKPGLNVEELAKLYVRGIDFCIINDYPTLDFIRDNFKGKCELYGVFVDDEERSIKNLPDVVLNGNCKSMMEYDGYTVSRIYARHNSKVSVNVSDHAIVTIDAFDNTDLVVAVAGKDAQVMVNMYGDSKIQCIGDCIKVKYNNKKTYRV